jgi:hypothetical protein
LVITKADEVQFNTPGSVKLPSGTTDQRAASPTAGMMRLNTDTNQVEVYQNSGNESVTFQKVKEN